MVWHNSAWAYTGDDPYVGTSFHNLQRRAESGDPEAQVSLAFIYDQNSQHEQALDLLRRAAEGGHAPAQHLLGARLLVGRAAPFEPNEGARLIAEAAGQGLPQSLALMSVLATLTSDWTSAVNYMKGAANQGDARAREQVDLIADPEKFSAGQWDVPLAPKWPFESPRVAVFENFLPPAFCEWIINRARPKLQATKVKDPLQGGGREVDYRSNSGAGFSLIDSDLVMQMVNDRVAQAVELPLTHQEPTNVLHYQVGQEYRPHHDFISESEKHAPELQVAGQRIVTFLIYLNDDFDGGETEFPELDWRFRGRSGDGLAFWNLTPEGKPDHRTLHAGLPPTRGEKWLYSKWVHVNPYPLI